MLFLSPWLFVGCCHRIADASLLPCWLLKVVSLLLIDLYIQWQSRFISCVMEKLEEWLQKAKKLLEDEMKNKGESFHFYCLAHVKKVMGKNPGWQIGSAIEYMLKTGRLATRSGLDLQEGSHFDSEGHERDIVRIRTSIEEALDEAEMTRLPSIFIGALPADALHILLDGRVVGSILSADIEMAVSHLRRLKLSTTSGIPNDLEVGYVPLSFGGACPGLYLFTNPSRFVRPVRNLSAPVDERQNIELIGPFEQVFMEIRCPGDGDGGRRSEFPPTHEEIHPSGIFSVVVKLTPWLTHNHCIQNRYQCQMAKQTMAFFSKAIHFRADRNSHNLQTPQTPIVQTGVYEKYCIDEYPMGMNAIVAVLACPGYDMNGALILNKSSVERGMFHGQIYQTETIDLSEKSSKADRAERMFRRSSTDKSVHPWIDSEGLPFVGQMIHPNEAYCSVYNEETNTTKNHLRKGWESVIVDSVVAVDVKNKRGFRKANICFRQPRNPVVGDKFSTMHAQEGACSQLWPEVDMPFSEVTGMRPDIIINPHVVASGTAIAMILGSVAAKVGSLDGKFMDATAFASSSTKTNGEDEVELLVDQLGTRLSKKGFNYHGSEVLYSGIVGTELPCEIFIGPLYYQRLRPVVSDKVQVRSARTVDRITRQPIEGEKTWGGIRFGEMERDSLLAHGAAYVWHDRLHRCSDYHIADVCSLCGSIFTTAFTQPQRPIGGEYGGLPPIRAARKAYCRSCQTGKGMETIAVPHVFIYLAAELLAMGIKMNLHLPN